MSNSNRFLAGDALAVFEATPAPYLILTPDLNIAAVNEAYLKATATTREKIIGKGLFEAFPDNPNDPKASGSTNLRSSLLKVKETGIAHRMPIQKYDIARPDGYFEVRYWSPLNSPVFDENKNLIYLIHHVEDVTEAELAKNHSAEIEKSAEHLNLQIAELNTLIENAPAAIYFGSSNGITRCNQRALEQLGFENLEQLNRDIGTLSDIVQNRDPLTKELLSPGDVPFVRALNGERSVRDTEVVHLKTGQRKIIRGAAAPVILDGKVVAAVAINSDVTEESERQLKLHETLEQLYRERELREQFVATLTHDLRTPLTAAKMSSQLISRKSHDQATVEKLSHRIIDNIDRADHMIRDLLDANLVKAGEKLPLEISFCHLSKIVSETLDELSSVHGDRFVLIGDSEIEGHWSCSGIRRILENLCNNAVKYGFPNEPVTVTVKRETDSVQIQVHNEGNPIPPEEQSRLFEPFARSESAQTSKQGWGLGLTLVKGIAEAHGGSIGLDSSEAQRGTTFCVRLPIDARK